MVKLIEQGEGGLDDAIEVMGRGGVEAVLELSGMEVAEVRHKGREGGGLLGAGGG